MKKLALILISIVAFPMMLSAQNNVKVTHQVPVDLQVTIPGYSAHVPSAEMNLNFVFDQEKETLEIHFNQGRTNCSYDKVWLPKESFTMFDMKSYMSRNGIKLKKAQTFIDQENFMNLSSRQMSAAIKCEGMTFTGVYDLRSPKKVKKALDHEMVPLDGIMDLVLTFKVTPKANNAVLTLCNPIPMNRKGCNKGIAAFVADDVVINIELGRCKGAEGLVTAMEEFNAMFLIAEEKLIELKKNPTSQKQYYNFIMRLYDEIDLKHYEGAGCDELVNGVDELKETKKRIDDLLIRIPPPPQSDCDVKSLNAEIKSTTTKLNNLVNDWSLAPDAASKAEKKAAFEAAYQKFDDKLNALPSKCRDQLDKKLMKDYGFVKKLVK